MAASEITLPDAWMQAYKLLFATPGTPSVPAIDFSQVHFYLGIPPPLNAGEGANTAETWIGQNVYLASLQPSDYCDPSFQTFLLIERVGSRSADTKRPAPILAHTLRDVLVRQRFLGGPAQLRPKKKPTPTAPMALRARKDHGPLGRRKPPVPNSTDRGLDTVSRAGDHPVNVAI